MSKLPPTGRKSAKNDKNAPKMIDFMPFLKNICMKFVYRLGGVNTCMNETRAVTSAKAVKQIQNALHRQHPRYGLLWMMGVETGLRISDLLTLQVRSLNQLPLPMTSIFVGNVYESKTGKHKQFTLGLDVSERLTKHIRTHRLKPEHYIFFSSATNKQKPISRQWAHRLIARTAKIRGLQCVGAHSMRKIYACNLYRATGSLSAVQKALNHSYPSTTLMYLRDLLPEIPQSGAARQPPD